MVIISSTSFTFDGAYLTAAWNDDLSVEVQGYSSSVLVYDTTVNPSATVADFFHVQLRRHRRTRVLFIRRNSASWIRWRRHPICDGQFHV